MKLSWVQIMSQMQLLHCWILPILGANHDTVDDCELTMCHPKRIWWKLGRVCINPSEMDWKHHYGVRTDNCDKSAVNTQAASWHLKRILNGSSHTMSQSILESWSSKVICILHSWFVNDLVWEALRLQKQNKQKPSSKEFLSFVQKNFLYIGQCAASFPDSKKIVWRSDGAEECTN